MMDDFLCNESNLTNDSALWLREVDDYIFEKTFNYPKHIFEKSITPIIYVLGFPGNALSIYIWMRPRMRHSSGWYLSALGLANLIFLLLHVIYYLIMSWHYKVLNRPVICEIYPFVSLAFQYLSPMLVLGFTVERYISICHPFKREKLCTQRRAGIVIACMYVGAFALCAIHSYFWTYKHKTGVCDVRPHIQRGGQRSVWSIWAWVTEMLIFLVVPLAVLFFNVIVIREARRLSQAARRLSQGKLKDKKSATTFMLLAVSFYLIFTTLPIAVTYASLSSFPIGPTNVCPRQIFDDPVWRSRHTFLLIRAVIQMIGMSHYACNFYIYLLTGKQFRQEVRTAVWLRFCSICTKRQDAHAKTSRNGDMTLYTSVPDQYNDGHANNSDSL